MQVQSFKYVIVGAGLWGCVLAERIATVLGEPVLVVERRKTCGGNCHSAFHPETGIECHSYGTHIFHTANPEVWQYITGFTTFTSYRHKVFTTSRGRVYPMPLGLAAVNAFYGKNLKPHEVEAFIAREAAGVLHPTNLEEKAISLVGRPLYEALIKGYTTKQWGRHPRDLPAEIITRLPVRTNYNTDYFNDPWQGLPAGGYGKLFEALLNNPRITILYDTPYRAIAPELAPNARLLYSGAPDDFFDYDLGTLEWRTLRFETEVMPHADVQGTAVMNEADEEVPYTRTHEFKHLHPERGKQGDCSVIAREYSKPFAKGDEPYYPVNTPENRKLLEAYLERARALGNIVFGGRLGRYRYMDMDVTIADALETFAGLKGGG